MANTKVLLIDVDSKIPNLALMKLSTFHKDDEVDFIRLGFSGYPGKRKKETIDASSYNKVYVSIIFLSSLAVISVSIKPGAIAFTLTLLEATSLARLLQSPMSPALDAE